MILRTLQQITGTEREIRAENGNWISRRLVLDDDQAGFSLHETTIQANTETRICYRHHLEAVYCVGGTGEIVELAKGARHPIADGTMYLLNEHDDHLLRAFSELRLICVFTPPLRGRETHDERGAYPPHPQAAYYELARKA